MKSNLGLILLFLCLSVCNESRAQYPNQKEGRATGGIDKEAIDQLVGKYLELDIFSGVVLVAEHGAPIYHKAFGQANRTEKTPNTIRTRFDIGSMNKSFTNAVILQLIAEGKLNKEGRIGEYLKGFPSPVAEQVKVSHLLSHTSGFGDYLAEPGFFELPKSEQTLAEILEKVKAMPLHFAPGTEQQYSNAGYIVLGGIIEAVTGQSYYQNVRKRILEPLKLRNTIVDDTKEDAPNRAIGYYRNTQGELFDNNGILMVPTPAGGFLATAEDVLTFYRSYFLGEELFSAQTARNDERLAFARSIKEKGRAMPVAGGFEGANSVVFAMVADDIFIIVLANMDEPVAEQLGSGIFSIINGREARPPALKTNQRIYAAYREQGINYVEKEFAELTDNFPPEEPKDFVLNRVGYDLLVAGEVVAALEIFELNTRLFPGVANTWDSLGEAYLRQGDKKKALENYRKALQIRPDLPSALEAVKRLSGE